MAVKKSLLTLTRTGYYNHIPVTQKGLATFSITGTSLCCFQEAKTNIPPAKLFIIIYYYSLQVDMFIQPTSNANYYIKKKVFIKKNVSVDVRVYFNGSYAASPTKVKVKKDYLNNSSPKI